MTDNAESVERALKEGLIADSRNGMHLYKLGVLCYYLGRFQEAAYYYAKAVEVSPDPDLRRKWTQELLEAERSVQYDAGKGACKPADFLDSLVIELLENSANEHFYNIDIELFELMHVPPSDAIVVNTVQEQTGILKHLTGISRLYALLADQPSRDLLVKLMAFRILGNKKVKLPLNSPAYWSSRQFVRKLGMAEDTIRTPYHQWDLQRFDLRPLGYELELYGLSVGLSATFAEKQYEYANPPFRIKVDPGDIVIDAGGCFGDTALYFAHEVGPEGHVYTIEFIPSNLTIMERNLSMNAQLQDCISIVERPVWSHSEQLLYYADQGPASFVSFNRIPEACEETLTLSIDDLVRERSIQKVDFIKMDVEGAELNALKGARKTLEAFSPKLAITIYHQISDFEDIAQYIDDLQLGYRFYLGHYTIYAQETVLFAVSPGLEESAP